MSGFMCDFETTTDPNDCRVWAACACDIDTNKIVHLSNNIASFMEWVEGFKGKTTLLFHNLKFDGEFIISYLFSQGFEYVSTPKQMPEKSFNVLVSDMGQFYKMTIRFEGQGRKKKTCDIYDSLKRLPFKVAKIAKDFGMSVSKGEIDYTAPRPIGYQPNEEEIDYIKRDCEIVSTAIKALEDEGIKKMTTASNAMAFYKEMMGRQFEYWFPVLPKILDDDIRRAYKGGFTYLNPRFRNQRIKSGIVFDVNSLYPSCMYYNLLPYGYPVYFEGKYEPDDYYPLYIARIRCAFRVKPGHIPCVQLKKSFFSDTEYLESSETDMGGFKELHEVEMTMTSVDLDLFMQQYDVYGLEYICGYKFKAQTGMFKEYIDHWMRIKETSPANSAQRTLAKLMLNSLYGKFASATERMKKTPIMFPDGVVRYNAYHEPETDKNGNYIFETPSRLKFKRDEEGYLIDIPADEVDAVYTPVGAFITAWARYKTITSAQRVYDRFIYADTDSLHLTGDELPEGLEIHPTRLGAWKHEGTFTDSKFLRAKTYMETIDGKTHVTCAGMPDNVKSLVNYDNFTYGAKFPGKLLPTRVPGGIVLQPVDFTIKGMV